jgi:iron complex transport system permease protein
MRRARLVLGLLVVWVGLCALFSLALGAMPIPFGRVARIIWAEIGVFGQGFDLGFEERSVVMAIRAPRVLLGLSVGAALGVSGALMQGLFRNPLADPGLIGVSSGAALGAKVVIVLGGALGSSSSLWVWMVPAAAFGCALGVTSLVWGLSLRGGRTEVATLLLAGIAVNAFAMSIQGLLSLVASDSQLRAITFWALGSLGGATYDNVWVTLPVALGVLACCPLLAPSLNALLLGESDACCLGVSVERLKRVSVLLASLAVGASVAFCGMVAFVGLMAPHLVRMVVGPDHRVVLPGSALVGAALLLMADLAARTLVPPQEIPLGILTAALGAPFFLWLLKRRQVGSGW